MFCVLVVIQSKEEAAEGDEFDEKRQLAVTCFKLSNTHMVASSAFQHGVPDAARSKGHVLSFLPNFWARAISESTAARALLWSCLCPHSFILLRFSSAHSINPLHPSVLFLDTAKQKQSRTFRSDASSWLRFRLDSPSLPPVRLPLPCDGCAQQRRCARHRRTLHCPGHHLRQWLRGDDSLHSGAISITTEYAAILSISCVAELGFVCTAAISFHAVPQGVAGEAQQRPDGPSSCDLDQHGQQYGL